MDSITNATIEPCDERSGVRVIARSKEPKPVGNVNKRNGKAAKVKHEPDALIGSQVTISRSLIDTWRSFCPNYQYNKGWVIRKMNAPHTPEFSTTRSFPGVVEEESFARVASRVLKVRASEWEEGTPPMTPLIEGNCAPLISLGRINIVRITERGSISSEENRAHQVYVLYA